ncbi:MAG: PqqD family peptide modification chaperone [Cyanobacteria bacterium]|jgi:hypothetical protein|nr:PqqD family peptide modification chaperone [Cyanobacteria bacterium GSL.Bin1]
MIQSSSLTPETLIVATQTAVMAELGSEAIVLDTASGNYYGFKNEVSTRIWQLIQQPTPISKICEAIYTEYEIDLAQCKSDVLNFLKVIFDKELVEIYDEKVA